jgi:large subunit ribosomal protein L4e
MARGHLVNSVPEFPLVVDNLNLPNTKSLLTALNGLGCAEDLAKVRNNRHRRAGQGKYRNSKYVVRKGPLLIHNNEEDSVKRAARNLPGVDTCNVHRLNILQLAPGGHLGRFLVFTQSAFRALRTVFGSHNNASAEKSGYHMNRSVMTCADLARIINSDQVQSKLRDTRTSVRTHDKNKKNPLNNSALMRRLNPFHAEQRRIVAQQEADRHARRAAALKEKRSKAGRAAKHARNVRWQGLQSSLDAAYQAAEDLIAAEEKAGAYVPGETDEEDE